MQHLTNKGLVMLENPAETWGIIKEIEPRVELQRHLFPKGLEWDGKKCRTPNISLSLETILNYGDDNSLLVAPIIEKRNSNSQQVSRWGTFEARLAGAAV